MRIVAGIVSPPSPFPFRAADGMRLVGLELFRSIRRGFDAFLAAHSR